MDSFKSKNVWIIGASSGIGESLAREIAARGGTLILSARREEALHDLNKDLDGQHHVMSLDASIAENVVEAAQAIKNKVSRIDSVVYLAAIYAPHSKEAKDIEFIHKMLSVNVGGAFNTVNAVQPIMEVQGGGQIALCGSVAGYRGLPYGQPYCATKAAIINYAESLKVEMEPQNIDVRVICPGFVKTPLTDKNDFPMPMMIEAEDAAKALAD